MRIIATIDNQSHAKRFSSFLRKKGIENTCEIAFDREQDKVICSVWIHEEDQVENAKQLFENFQKDPDDPSYRIPETEKKAFSAIENPHQNTLKSRARSSKSPFMWVTYFFLGLCVLVYLINSMQELSIARKEGGSRIVILTPVQFALLYDVPTALVQLDKLLQKYPISKNADPGEISEEVKQELAVIDKVAYFRGFYEWIVTHLSKKAVQKPSGPMFVKIREGEVWRLFSPCVLHKDLIHILFNMLWLWVLGKQIEMRVPRFRFFLMILIAGIISNTAQYLMSGPYFLGFSGVIMAMAGFIWMRQRVAPWEGYPLHKGTLLFLAFFVLVMIGLQIVSLAMQLAGKEFQFNIANSAHVSGALIGALLGRLSFFSWRAS